jgi:hypothetical protein
MASGFTVFLTYQLEGAAYSANTSYGHSTPLHCAYIQEITTDTLSGKFINCFFPSQNAFPFLVEPSGVTTKTGFTATKVNVLTQIVSGITDSTVTIEPDPNGWFKRDVTAQITGHTVGQPLSPFKLANTTFQVNPNDLGDPYDLMYLNYPTSLSVDDDKLSFGEEVFFYGNISADIRARAFTTDIPVTLSLGEFNGTTNPSWDGQSSVFITEIGIYDEDENLLAIRKLANPNFSNEDRKLTIP